MTERVAVVIVHGMGNQRPVSTVNGFVDSALATFGGSRVYYSRPALLTDFFEARRLVAIEMERAGATARPQVDLYEYHWSYLMTGNKIGHLVPTTLRLLIRPFWRLPTALWFYWFALLGVALFLAFELWTAATQGRFKSFKVKDIIEAITPNVWVAAALSAFVFAAASWATSNLVDVVRYLDTSPRSYEVRRAIRGGMVELLSALQDPQRKPHAYNRIVVVAHSLGGYVAYDGITSLWTQTDRGQDQQRTYTTLGDLEAEARRLPEPTSRPPTDQRENLADFREAQNKLWAELQQSETRWLISDFVTLGTPMYMADLLYTRSRRQFNTLRRRSELPQCPPRSDTEPVEPRKARRTKNADNPPPLSYGWRGEKVLVTGSPFAAVRWTNLWYPARLGLFGDPFGGALQPLFGSGINDRKVTARGRWPFVPILAHTHYFSYPDQTGDGIVTTALRDGMALEPTLTTMTGAAPNAEPN
ncbi:MAG: hypothetical protein PGN37_01130 [Mycobacterium kyogaense]|uniref:hypothetical protein n=1 Tax=Mycobacterium kyogaense TaxID=2212479 RepID=UPI002FF5C58F